MTILEASCCITEDWHPHSKCEWHKHVEEYHLVAWDLRTSEKDYIDSCGWSFCYGREEFEGRASSLDEAKGRAEKAMEAHRDMMTYLECLDLRGKSDWT